jgi:hypothetical protein
MPVSADTWHSGQRNFGNVSVEPAVNMADGSQIETPRTLRVSHSEGSVSSLAPLDGLATVLKRRAGGNRLAPMPPYRSHTVRLLTGSCKLNNEWGI